MKVLMFGWEFPPYISGGLGTACYGLTRGLVKIPDLDLMFVVPKAYGDENFEEFRFMGANQVQLNFEQEHLEKICEKLEYIEINSRLIPYKNPEEFEQFIKNKENKAQRLHLNKEGGLDFSGKYGPNLMQEIRDYAIVARKIAMDNSFDLIHAHDWLAYPAGIAAKEISKKPLVIHVHATDFDRSGGKVNPAVFEIEKKGMTEADQIIAVSNLTRKTIIEKYGISPEKVVTVYNAVEPAQQNSKLSCKKAFDEKIITFMGRLTMQKGPEYFVEVATQVLNQKKNVRFVMAGDGDMMEKLVRLVAERGISDRFHFTGFLRGKEIPEIFALTDLYIMPSESEPFGIVPLEAMQCDTPVLISRQSGVAEVLTYAMKTDYWDIDAMAELIHGYLEYNTLTDFFVQNGRQEVNSLKWEHSALNVKEVYDKTLQTS